MRNEVSDDIVRKGRLAVGALALGGAAAVVFGLGDKADAATVTPPKQQAIRSGDTLSAIAAKHKVSVEALAKANNLSVNDVIYSGASLSIPTTGTERSIPAAETVGSYVVKRGDTLSSIAAAHKCSVAALASANNMSTTKVLSIGRTLSIPGAVDSSPAASTAPKVKTDGKSGIVPTDLPSNDPRWALKTQFNAAAARHGVSAGLLEAMTWNESGWQNHVISGVGARGIGQIMPGTAQHINEMAGKKLDPNNTSDNIEMSAIYLRYLMDANHGDYKMALASYYQGLGSVRSNGLYTDTKQYVATITALQRNYFR